ncbi:MULTISPECIES: AraC family transcriptional regulator [unclassified Breznakia]|uniref:AraC family transcriptional regulator n=1 Tax=unclassified Breznakia TaxID=2623764 RepID=UPI0024764604|nr:MULTISPECIES: AraC family transcriptional regulator [unclassified Breznakia]MDH6367651.1 AraC family transcriptional regulator [Breznakia sp. PH1-1]MDH6404756.1 AraC family transcriptional regulator [Breznakia sp. PF1-11]MDH6412471.1 AraC family transcriptional regulator [Breznakia sp. PFB1-11]MDH6414831.1 AraC family transcriptional regulator [Breznakia sp. PFB1-14]MDH6417125.1 AraC family transcriptional regulator [Breznakia sp. PFB1-4]
MEWIENLNASIAYIEEHITDSLHTKEIAKVANCSTYHYQRIFAYMTGISLSEYIRRRRMSLAAVDLKNTDMKIIDITLKYGYNSPTAFNRAFQSVHGIAPSLVKNEGVLVKSYPALTFQMSIQGTESLDFRIESKKAFRVIGSSIDLHGEFKSMDEPVKQIWEKCEKDGTIQTLIQLTNRDSSNILEVMIPDTYTENWKYMLAVETDKPIHTQLDEYTVESYTWAIFSYEGKTPEEAQIIGNRIIYEWLPTSGYEYDNGPDIAIHTYIEGKRTILEYWLPIKNKQQARVRND